VVAVQNGLKFSPMDETDSESFAGAPEGAPSGRVRDWCAVRRSGALIAYSDIAVYILNGNMLSVLTEDLETEYVLSRVFQIER